MENTTSQSPSPTIPPPIVQDKQKKEEAVTGTLLDFDENDFNDKLTLERSMSSDTNELDSSVDLRKNPLDNNLNSNKPSSQNNASSITLLSPTQRTMINKTEQKAPSKHYLNG
jgi:hypothetical protein